MEHSRRYRKKPVVIEAIQWTGENGQAMRDFFGNIDGWGFTSGAASTGQIFIQTLEGTMLADRGDYIIKGVRGEYYPCKPDIFEETYEAIYDIPAI
jgi:hypothetical protein